MKVFRKLIALISMCLLVLLLSAATLVLLPAESFAKAGDLVLTSSTAGDAAGASHSEYPSISADARYVAFMSHSNNFPGQNGQDQIYRKDLYTKAIVLVSSTAGGAAGDLYSYNASISADGRYVAFRSHSSNFPSQNGKDQIYRKDLSTNAIVLVSSTTGGAAGASDSILPAISADGRYVAFVSLSNNFPGQNGQVQIYRKDLSTKAIVLVSSTAGDATGASWSVNASISSDGRYAAFRSVSNNFPGQNGQMQIYRKDLSTGAIVLASSTAGGTAGALGSDWPAISADGRCVAFRSGSNNFPGHNGTLQVYRKDLSTKAILLASCTAGGAAGTTYSYNASMSADGRYVVFLADSNNFPGQNGAYQVYRKDLSTNAIVLVSSTALGAAGAFDSDWPLISADGRYVAFVSLSNNFPGQNGWKQVYRKQLYVAPTITSISPSSKTAGDAAFTLTVNGTGFENVSKVRWNAKDRTTTYVSSTRIKASIPKSDIASAGTAAVTVFNPGTAGGLSNTKTFTINTKPPPTPPHTQATWYLAEGSTNYGFDAYITIQNPNTSAVTAQITYMTGSGPVTAPDVTLPAKSQATINPKDKLGNQDFSTKVLCKEGKSIAVDRTMSWTGPGAASPEAHSSIGVTSPGKTWYLPEGSSKWGFECWLLIQNPNASAASCNITYMIEGAGPKTVTKTVPASSRKSFNIAEDIGEADASIKVEGNIPVIPERAMYRNNRREGHDSIGTTSPNTDFYLAEGTSAYGFTTYVLIQNPNPDPTDVTVTYMTGAGPKPQAPFNMPANSRKTIRVNDVEGMGSTDFSTQVTGTKPIIAERSMYWDNGTGEACHDSVGMASSHTSFYLPDGQTSEGRETYTLVQNPNSSAVTVEITYMTPTGAGNKTFTDTIPANSRKTYNMGDKGIQGRASVMVISKTSGKKIMVERAMYWNSRGAGTDTIGGFSD